MRGRGAASNAPGPLPPSPKRRPAPNCRGSSPLALSPRGARSTRAHARSRRRAARSFSLIECARRRCDCPLSSRPIVSPPPFRSSAPGRCRRPPRGFSPTACPHTAVRPLSSRPPLLLAQPNPPPTILLTCKIGCRARARARAHAAAINAPFAQSVFFPPPFFSLALSMAPTYSTTELFA